MPLSKRVDGQRRLGFYCFFLYRQNLGTALMWGRLVPCLFSLKKRRKDGGMGGRETGKEEKPEEREEVCFQVVNVNRNKYKIFISMQKVFRKTMMYGICGVLFFVLALFVFVKAFNLLAVTNQILQGEL